METGPRNILVLLIAGLTRTTLAIPALKSLRGQFANSRITVAASAAAAELVRLSGCADEVLPAGRLRHGEIFNPGTLLRTRRTWIELQHGQFDLLIDLSRGIESSLLARRSGRVRAIGPAPGVERMIEKFSRALAGPQSAVRHIAHEYLEMLEPYGVRPLESEPRISTDPAADARIEKLLARRGAAPGELLVGISPSSGPLRARWPFERYTSIASRLIHNFGARLLVFAGPMERGSAKRLARAIPSKSAIALESPPLGDFISAAARLSLFIGNHSGPAHVAAAAGSPVIAISITPGPSPDDLLGSHTRHLRGLHPDLISEEDVYSAACAMLKLNRAEFLRGR